MRLCACACVRLCTCVLIVHRANRRLLAALLLVHSGNGALVVRSVDARQFGLAASLIGGVVVVVLQAIQCGIVGAPEKPHTHRTLNRPNFKRADQLSDGAGAASALTPCCPGARRPLRDTPSVMIALYQVSVFLLLRKTAM